MTDKPKFVLKLSGINLDHIKAGDIGRLLNDFCKLLDDDFLFFEAIYPGSAVLKVSTEPEYYDEKLDKLNSNITRQAPALEDINKVLRGYSKTNKEIKASILASRTAVNDEDMELIHQIDYCKPNFPVFKQTETFMGRFFTGKLEKTLPDNDGSDYFTIILANDEVISVSVPKVLSLNLASYLPALWRQDSLVKFTGTACYELQDNYEMILKSFEASSFEIVENDTTANAWIDEFISQGMSGWQDIDDPIDLWLKERHS
ncbi:hypothetical protein [Psychrobacter phenylpyruvicus]|uniref:Uncharacterized protein n=2 Tax=Psychrobacter phenylpyruvicus TaxID=29432 RepID=A0A379LGN5_9GAMM|nr:hypothetical protein [Psychrobacter phenylpyruvicus]SUD89740.1 Uncharacterised protein [Psychrobacter phenylpyruvicus]